MRPVSILFFILITLISTSACVAPKESRQLKKNTKDWRESPVILEAYADSPFASTFLILRKNQKFEHTSSGMLQTFEAGSWTIHQDTIQLSYVYNNQEVYQTEKVYIDRKKATLIFEGNTLPVPTRLRIIINDL